MSSKANTQQENKIARVHGGQSNRRTKDRGERKTVFKSVLSNPLEVKWPIVAQDVQNATLDRIIELLQGVAEYNLNRQKRTRETRAIKRAEKRAKKSGQINAQQQQQRQNAMEVDIPAPNASTSTAPAPAPEILQHVTIGINAVTKRLEEQCYLPPRQNIKKSPAETSSNCPAVATANSGAEGSDAAAVAGDDVAMGNAGSCTDANPAAARAPIRTVLVCRPDIDPAILIAHIPYLVAACNSKGNHSSSSSSKGDDDSSATHDPGTRIKLVSLPKGAELKLAKATGLRRVSVLALDEAVSRDAILSQHLSSIETIVAPWLMGFGAAETVASAVRASSATVPASGSTPTPTPSTEPKSRPKFKSQTKTNSIPPERARMLRRRLEPTHIKQLRTTAPKDMRAAKALRAKGRALAKEERKAKQTKEALEKKSTGKRKSTVRRS